MVSIGDWSTRPATHCPLGTHFDSVVDELDLKGGGAGSLWQVIWALETCVRSIPKVPPPPRPLVLAMSPIMGFTHCNAQGKGFHESEHT